MRKMLPEKGAEGREKQKISTRNREQIIQVDKGSITSDGPFYVWWKSVRKYDTVEVRLIGASTFYDGDARRIYYERHFSSGERV